MSLINDALKQAREKQLTHPPAPGPGAQLRAPEPASSESPGTWLTLPSFVYLALLLTFLLLGVVFLRVVTRRLPVKAAPLSRPIAVATSVPSPERSAAPASGTARSGKGLRAPGTADTGTPAPTVPEYQPAPLKLQAVFYSPTKPSAIISGTTVFVGDRIRDFRVTSIGKDNVTLSRGTETSMLKLEVE
jgi:hypothetical protein